MSSRARLCSARIPTPCWKRARTQVPALGLYRLYCSVSGCSTTACATAEAQLTAQLPEGTGLGLRFVTRCCSRTRHSLLASCRAFMFCKRTGSTAARSTVGARSGISAKASSRADAVSWYVIVSSVPACTTSIDTRLLRNCHSPMLSFSEMTRAAIDLPCSVLGAAWRKPRATINIEVILSPSCTSTSPMACDRGTALLISTRSCDWEQFLKSGQWRSNVGTETLMSTEMGGCASLSALSAASGVPSSTRSIDPDPVVMCEMSSSTPAARAAATVFLPPTTLMQFECPIAVATAFVPLV
mmetsp:Transcript_2403/g.7488  ORF Transcript_2403/g.7488 Transcript_2403/m.7488 type:complete len:299 (+) Transcript_2403:79-975(+)